MKTDLFFRSFIICVSMMMICACHGGIEPVEDSPQSKVKLKVVVPVAETKLTDAPDESRIDNYQVYIFGSDGVLESYVNQESSDIVLDCIAGAKSIVVLANAPAMTDVTTVSSLSAKTSLLSDNHDGTFVMSGQHTTVITEDTEITVTVSRIVSKIILSELKVDFLAPQYQNSDFKVSSVYLINVPAEAGYLSVKTPGVWYNKQEYVSADANALIRDAVGSVPVSESSLYPVTNTFYCYPNPTDQDSFDMTWSARHTRLVVEASLGTNILYYPVTLPKLESNKIYDVSLTITRPGASKPDAEVDKYAADFSITVKDWETGASVIEEI